MGILRKAVVLPDKKQPAEEEILFRGLLILLRAAADDLKWGCGMIGALF